MEVEVGLVVESLTGMRTNISGNIRSSSAFPRDANLTVISPIWGWI